MAQLESLIEASSTEEVIHELALQTAKEALKAEIQKKQREVQLIMVCFGGWELSTRSFQVLVAFVITLVSALFAYLASQHKSY